MLKNIFSNFRIISYIEGLSYLILLFIAMPIKYLGNNPYPVKIVGMTHGLLFILFLIALYFFAKKYKCSLNTVIRFFIYSILPFGFIFIEKSLQKRTKEEE